MPSLHYTYFLFCSIHHEIPQAAEEDRALGQCLICFHGGTDTCLAKALGEYICRELLAAETDFDGVGAFAIPFFLVQLLNE